MDKKADTRERIKAMERVHRRLFRMEAEREAKEAAAHCDAENTPNVPEDIKKEVQEILESSKH